MALPKTPALTVDCVVFDARGRVLLIRRKNEPFKGAYALPGGFAEIGETVEAACRRELLEETGIEAGDLRLVGVYSDPARDPRGHTVSVVYLAEVAGEAEPQAGSDAAGADWVADWHKHKLAFDHAQILEDLERLRRGVSE
ncbi:MAG: NUDIX hydrolase [Methyloceanibacter sp.]